MESVKQLRNAIMENCKDIAVSKNTNPAEAFKSIINSTEDNMNLLEETPIEFYRQAYNESLKQLNNAKR